MNEINEIIRKNHLNPKKYTKKKNVILIETNTGKYRIKYKEKDNKKIYDYLKTRNFNYIPKIINEENEQYEITEYIESYDIPNEQKIIDLIDIISLLHNKTTHYKEATEDDYKETYEDLKNNIIYLEDYYNNLITVIDTKVYMSPSEYALARNISRIFKTLIFLNDEIEEWYKLVKNKNKKRLVVIHNNLELDHFLISEREYLISWDKAKIDMPIFDIYKLYKKHGIEYDFSELFKRYEKKYPLYEEEIKLFFILILLPPKLELNKSEYENTKEVANCIYYLEKTQEFISPYYSKKREKNDAHE